MQHAITLGAQPRNLTGIESLWVNPYVAEMSIVTEGTFNQIPVEEDAALVIVRDPGAHGIEDGDHVIILEGLDDAEQFLVRALKLVQRAKADKRRHELVSKSFTGYLLQEVTA